MTTIAFTKGHGTENDFVLIPDLEGGHDLSELEVLHLVDRRSGLGADGVIRIVPTIHATEPEVREQGSVATWFMDYRNADGSASEMCGNGARVFAAYLHREGLETSPTFSIATRAGVRAVTTTDDGYAVDLGPWHVVDPAGARDRGFGATVRPHGGVELPGLRLELGNPHTVVILPPEIDLNGLDLSRPPLVSPEPSHGTNVEFVRAVGPGHIAMRVHERGVGETRSCGTGAAAAALATRWWEGESADNTEWLVDVPGGRLTVRVLPGQHVQLAGPAVLVADGTIEIPA